MSATLEDVCWNCIEENNFRKAKLFLKNGTKADKILDSGISIIHLLSGREDCGELLEMCLKEGTSPNIQNSDGITPVHVASIWGMYYNLCVLLKYKGDPKITDKNGLNALDYACQSSESQAELCVQHLRRIITGDGYLTEISSFDDSAQESFEIENAQKFYPSIQACVTDTSDQELYIQQAYVKKNDGPYTKLKSSGISKHLTLQDEDEYFKGSASPDNADCNSTYTITTYSEPPTTIGKYTDVNNSRDFMTEDDESSSDAFASGATSFFTACEGDLTLGVLDNTVVTFPKLHPWTVDKGNDNCLDDTVIGNMEKLNMDCSNDSFSLETPCITNGSVLSNETVLYDWKEYSILETSIGDTSLVIPDSLLSMNCQQLKKELEGLGEDPGPVREDTKMLYAKRLARLKNGMDSKPSDKLKEFFPEVRAIIEGRLPSTEMYPAEESMCVEFTKKDLRDKWREGTEKSSFNYLLLDPRVTQNLPLRSKNMMYEDIFHTFVAGVFYVGKGKRSRPYAHLYEASNHSKVSRKLQQIRAIWSTGLGVVSLHCFQGVIPVEAYTREACMVDALGLTRLTNKKRGDYYGRAKSWSIKKKREMGVFLLKRALQIFLHEGERQIRPEDLKTK